MDVFSTLSKELDTKSGLSLEEQKRYLYIRICQLFSYDSRLSFLDLLGPRKTDLKNEILNKKIDLTNENDFIGCCSSISLAYSNVLYELLNVKADRVGSGHFWVESESPYGRIKADPTLGDLTRAKLGIETKGYALVNKDRSFKEVLKIIDHNIQYIEYVYQSLIYLLLYGRYAKDYIVALTVYNDLPTDADEKEKFIFDFVSSEMKYEDEGIENLFYHFGCNFDDPWVMSYYIKYLMRKIISQTLKPDEQIVVEKLIRIEELFNGEYKFHNYEDAKFVIGYLFKIFMGEVSYNEIDLVCDIDKDAWTFMRVYRVNYESLELYYTLEKIDDVWKFMLKNKDEVLQNASNYLGHNKELLYK